MCFLLETQDDYEVMSSETTQDYQTPTPSWEKVLATQSNIPLYTGWVCSRTYKRDTCMSCQTKLSHVAFSEFWVLWHVTQPSQCPMGVRLPALQHLWSITKKCDFFTLQLLTILRFDVCVFLLFLFVLFYLKGFLQWIPEPA